MNGRRLSVSWVLIILAILIISCQSEASEDELSGRITFWHTWSPADAEVLQQALDQYQELHPKVSVIPVALPEDRILEEFIEAGSDGLGPGLVLGEDGWIGELVSTGLLRPLDPRGAENSLFTSRNRSLTQYQDEVYGVPLSLDPRALYYNKRLVDEPPGTLDEVLQHAADGKSIAFVPRFEEAFWGIQTFGDGLFDGQGRFTLAESGFTEWLIWLDEAQRSPGIILNVDDASLLELFATEQIAYYVAGPEKEEQIVAQMNEEDPFEFGVVPLPGGPQGASGPLLPAETILLYAFTSDGQTRIADDLAGFLVNQQQSIHFMRELNKVPANPAVRVDGRIYPIVNGFARQARTAVVLPNEVPTDLLTVAGDRAYVSALSGALTPAEAVCRFGREVAAFQGYTEEEMSLPADCPSPE